MSVQRKRDKTKGGDREKGSNVCEKVVVAVKSSKEVPKTALVWALTHVVQPGDCITFLVVVPSNSSGRKFWGFPRFAGDCANSSQKSNTGTCKEQKFDITDSCSQMILQLHDVYDPNKINVKIKIASGSPCGAVAAEAKKALASWVVLDKQLEQEKKCCMEELQCNIVVMKHSQAKVLRLNLVGSSKKERGGACSLPSDYKKGCEKNSNVISDALKTTPGSVVTPNSSPEVGTPFTITEAGTSSVSSSDQGTSPYSITERKLDLKEEQPVGTQKNQDIEEFSSETEGESPSSSLKLGLQPWMEDILNSHRQSPKNPNGGLKRSKGLAQTSTTKALLEKFPNLDQEAGFGMNSESDLDYSENIRHAISLSRKAAPGPPPLCSICQHKAPVFGKPPKLFSYAELDIATGGFSEANFLAEGGYGSVHRGVLPDGRAIAVKQHKLASSQGDLEFCSEVEVLSCAQHRNVVMLIGFCIEDKRRLLVYEYICNGSLDSHLYSHHLEPLEWYARQKIAAGAARGLRYLHEECRVGCIVHRDVRPNNILITHDFEPLVGDFGLARWQPDGDTGVQTRVIGTFGYLAPEYAQSGQITEKADVYSFGVVLVELVTGRKAVDLKRPKGQQCLAEWARPLLEEYAIDKLIDPRLGEIYSEREVYCMLHAASLCIRRDPHSRPRMSQVLRILEGDMVMDSNSTITPAYSVSSCSGWIRSEQPQQVRNSPLWSETDQGSRGRASLASLKSGLLDRQKAVRDSRRDADM